MLDSLSMGVPPNVTVHKTNNRGHSPEELADMMVDRVIQVSGVIDNPEAQAQANAYKDYIKLVMADGMKRAIMSYKTSQQAALIQAGHADMALIIRDL